MSGKLERSNSIYASVDPSQLVTVAAQNLTYSVLDNKTKQKRQILNKVNFVAKPGKLLAIMGEFDEV
jgi:ABC-type transport system involved in Fe-S cluster assembly fused permease/ATPase subunit